MTASGPRNIVTDHSGYSPHNETKVRPIKGTISMRSLSIVLALNMLFEISCHPAKSTRKI